MVVTVISTLILYLSWNFHGTYFNAKHLTPVPTPIQIIIHVCFILSHQQQRKVKGRVRGQSTILFKTGLSTQNSFFVCFVCKCLYFPAFQHVHFLFRKSDIRSRHPDEPRGKRTESKKRIHRHVYVAKEPRVKREHTDMCIMFYLLSAESNRMFTSRK